MTSIDRYENSSFIRAVYFLMQASAYVFVLYAVTDLRKGGDLKYIIPYVSLFFSLFYLIQRKDFHLFSTPLFQALSGYVLVSYLLVPFSVHPQYSFFALNSEIFSGFSLFISIYSVTRTWESSKKMVIFFIIMLALVVSAGFITYFTDYASQTPILFSSPDHLSPNINKGLIKIRMHHNSFAWTVNLLFTFSVAYLALIRKEKKLVSLIIALVIILSIVAVLLSLSRGGWFSLMLTIFLWIVFFNMTKFALYKSIFVFFFFVIVLFFALWVSVPAFRNRIIQTPQAIETVQERTQIWIRTIKAIKESPLVGWGYGNKISWDGRPVMLYKETEKELFFKLGPHAHNIILHVFFHQGLVGLLFFLWFMITGFLSVIRALKSCNEMLKLFYFAVFSVFVSVFMIHGLIEVIPFVLICLIMGFFSGMMQVRDSDRSQGEVQLCSNQV
jgi:O-antigen ligase